MIRVIADWQPGYMGQHIPIKSKDFKTIEEATPTIDLWIKTACNVSVLEVQEKVIAEYLWGKRKRTKEQTPARQPHPQRCETCYYPHQMKDESGNWKRCPIAKCELSFERLSLIDIVGCASHSAAHTPATPAKEPDYEGDCDTCRFVKECTPLYLPPCYNGDAIRAAKAEREQDQKQWQKLEDYIDANSPWIPGTDDRVTDARKLIAEVRSLRGGGAT